MKPGTRMPPQARAGMTLLETLVALTVLALLISLAGAAAASLRLPEPAEAVRALNAARTAAIRSGHPVVWRQNGQVIRFLPDGSSSGGVMEWDGKRYVVDPVTGATRAAR